MIQFRALLLVCFALAGLQLAYSAAAHADAHYFIDFERGDDTRDGLSPERAWRHAPGDRNAQGRPAALKLNPGDNLLFAPGVRYRGEIKLNGSGSADRPVVISSAPGGGSAIIDGSDLAADVRPCRSADDCGGSPIWKKLVRADFGRILSTSASIFTEDGLLFPAQFPPPSDPFNSDNTAEYMNGNFDELQRGEAHLPPDLARALAGSGEKQLVLELYANELAIRDVTAIQGDVARFDAQGLRFNKDRPARFAVTAHPALVQRPGEFGILPGGTIAVIYPPRETKTISLGSGRGGIDLSSHSFVQIRNLTFENMSDDGASAFAGVAIFKSSQGSDIVIEHNRFKNFRLLRGSGPLAFNFITRLKIRGNDIQSIAFGSGIRLYKDIDVNIANNTISRIGRTGIMLIDVQHSLITGNLITDARGIHGNGMSAYRDNHDIRIIGNTIATALRPVTIGHASREMDNALVFERNLMVGTADSLGALTSWGNGHGVTIRNNLLLGGKAGLDLSSSDTSMIIVGNVMNGPAIVKHRPYKAQGSLGYIPAGWHFIDNKQLSYVAGRKLTDDDAVFAGAVEDAMEGGRTGAWRRLCDLLLPARQSDVNGSELRIGAKLDCSAGLSPSLNYYRRN